jgi:hypothetical protein
VYWDTTSNVTSKSHRLTGGNLLEITAPRVWLLAIDPSGQHEIGPAVAVVNRLTLTHQPREATGGKRTVELKVVPDGIIRYTVTGSNPAEGTNYTGPFEIGAEETTIYAYAEADGISTRRTFTIPKAGNSGIKIDPLRPARLRKRVDATDTASSFGLIMKARQAKARLGSAQLEVGQGGKAATVRFGSETSIVPEVVEQLVQLLRTALSDETADVRFNVRQIDFVSGHDLDGFVADRGLSVAPNEVDQS